MVSGARGDSAGSVTYHCLSMRLIVYADWFCSLKLKRRPMKEKKKNISTNHDGCFRVCHKSFLPASRLTITLPNDVL
ncbi:hypothetical protein E2C01_010376 [Portunus trituberculatus]|uniref:Uncharacterized protein n=1 Tax=Portunus trituberculatus TaxID=210409 RepID=A0A5B7D8G5_PORTR|nr:hypothetical protein [Portunus trituberculatus]